MLLEALGSGNKLLREMLDEEQSHVHLSNGPTSMAYKPVLNSAGPQPVSHAPVEQQAPFGEVMMNTGFLPAADNGNVDSAHGNRWTEGETRNTLFPMSMSHTYNQHVLTDPSIQETLSPFFQPFGVDVSHLPMTNPPIFQSSLTRYDEPGRRRRISISNGQISQLGADLETVENLYNTQPPPLPQRFENQQVKQHYYEQPAGVNIDASKGGLIHLPAGENAPQAQAAPVLKTPSWNSQPTVKEEKAMNNPLPDDLGTRNEEFATAPSAPLSANGYMSRTSSSSCSNSASFYGQPSNYNSKNHRSQDPVPGTNAWKRARLLERNRIAASKCRQRKKVAQLQLQKDYDLLVKENKVMKKKLDYYEKLVSKFKKFSESHFKKCAGGDSQSFDIIEEMLMIDSDVQEVDNDGLVVKIEES